MVGRKFDFGDLDPVDEYLRRVSAMVDAISRPDVYAVIQVLYEAWLGRKQVFIFGNGGSAATASHMANDLCKYTIVEGQPRLKAIALTDNIPLLTAWANDVAYEQVFAQQLLNFVEPGDVAIAISASGNSANVLRALETARRAGARCVGLTGDTGGKLKELVDICVLMPDEQIGCQEDGHMILDHVIALTLHRMIEKNHHLIRKEG